VDRGIQALLDLKEDVDAFFTEIGWECRLNIKAHWGSVIAGPYGGASDKRFDILGKAVNETARLKGAGVVLSAKAFHKLGPDVQARFTLDAPAGTYVPRSGDGARR
jgi:class 3 adenylate cyclase